MKKKISLPIAITIALVVAAIAFSLAYIIATNKMNAKLTDLGEKHAMFSTLAEVDNFAREKSFHDVDEEILNEELCRAYAKAYEGRVIYLSPFEYSQQKDAYSEGYTTLPLADGSMLIVLTEEQYAQTPDATNGPGADPEARSSTEAVTEAAE